MTWEEFKKQLKTVEDYEDTDIECPKCGKKIKRYTREVFTSYPAKHSYRCFNCGWGGMA